jgi:alkanesulfonate monooxygenase SsuD/methylene tetrahydromethanopterin reductase-like flavin-dependent oxidoreductase (luciferase family)
VRRFAEMAARGEFPLALVRDEMIDSFAVAGSPERCRQRLAEIIDAGVTHPVVFELPGLSPERILHDVHTHLMPYFL